jgi:hypothetical protein
MMLLNIETGVDLGKIIKIGEEIIKEIGVEKRTSINIDDLKDIDKYRKMLI